MKYILVEMPNDTPDELIEGFAVAIRKSIEEVTVMKIEAIVRFGGLYTSL